MLKEIDKMSLEDVQRAMSNEPVPEKKPQSIMKKNETLTETPIEEEMELEQQYPTKSSEAKNFPVEIRV